MSASVRLPWLDAPPGSRLIERRGRSFLIEARQETLSAAHGFAAGREDSTLQFLDAALPACSRMIDVGAGFGFTTLYAAASVLEVIGFEPSPGNFAVLSKNVARNAELALRVRLFSYGLADHDGEAAFYAGTPHDEDASMFATVERDVLQRVPMDTMVTLRNADTVLRVVGCDSTTLLKIDIAGTEYRVLPAIADLLAERRPYLHVTFRPFNVVVSADEYRNAIARLRRAMEVAEAVACYRYLHLFSNDTWFCVRTADRMDFLRQYLIRPKPVAHVGSEQYGFIGAVGFSDAPLPTLRGG